MNYIIANMMHSLITREIMTNPEIVKTGKIGIGARTKRKAEGRGKRQSRRTQTKGMESGKKAQGKQ